MRRFPLLCIFCVFSLCGFAQYTKHKLQIGQSCSADVGSMDYLNPHCAYKTAGINKATVYGISRGTAFSIGRNNDIHVYVVLDVVDIDIPESLNLCYGETFTYTPIVTDAEAKTTLTWASNNTAVATVDDNGVVTTVGPGKANITCTATNGVSAQSLVTVTPKLAEELSLDKKSYELSIGESFQLQPTILPLNATSSKIKWLSSNENIAQVDDEGNVTAINYGYCSIFAVADDGSAKFDHCLITVPGTRNRGDVNNDGVVDINDVTGIVKIIQGIGQ